MWKMFFDKNFKNIKKIFIILPAVLFLIFVSCASKPAEKPKEEEPSGENMDRTAPDALNRAKADAETSRKRALLVEGDVNFPEDWKNAESLYLAAGNAPADTPENIQKAIAQYKNAQNAYEAIFQKGLPAYAEKRRKELEEARQAAWDAGSQSGFGTDSIVSADASAEKARALYEKGDYEAFLDAVDNPLLLYHAMKTLAEAYNKRWRITDKELQGYDKDEFGATGEVFAQAENDYSAGKGADALKKAEESLNRYTVYYDGAIKARAEEQAALAETARQNACEVKADFAAQSDFNSADKMYNQGQREFTAGQFEDAVQSYTQAQVFFAHARDAALKKRDYADAMIKAAEQKSVESDAIARDAAQILEGGSK